MVYGRFESLYIFISVVVMIMDVVTAFHCFYERKKYSNILGVATIGVGFVQLFYLLSLFFDEYSVRTGLSSLYYISIVFSLVVLLTFVRGYTINENKYKSYEDHIRIIVTVAFAVDAALFLINPFKEIMVHYEPNDAQLANFDYVHKPLFWVHMVICYVIVMIVLYYLIRRVISVPTEYRKQYTVAVLALLGVILVNAIDVFMPGFFGEEVFDYSVWGYSILALSLYVNFFRYPVNGMKGYYHEWIVENVNQGMVLFNYEGKLIIHNSKIHSLFPDKKIVADMTVEDFVKELNLDVKAGRSKDNYSFQHYVNIDGKEVPIRFDHRCPRNIRGESLGELFIFTDEQGEMDLLTSFYAWESFKQIIKDEPEFFLPPLTISVCDINGLGEINRLFGHHVGDQSIQLLANTVRKHFASESYYVRGREASLVILSFELTEAEAREKMDAISKELMNPAIFDRPLDIQSAVETVTAEEPDILMVVERAFKGMKTKKLLDVNSSKSELVTSLVKTLAECDVDTEAHVKRTQAMGAELGSRLGLSDSQLSDLALLCILHDIGKISIPLEILNKPAKLNDDEWRMMKTHTEKGYQIATSSRELEHIADMILHHHECWNGRGYPDGLSKESIPLLSRIISVVDAYDAMVNDRIYRPAMSVEEALAELRRCAGTQFDPSIVNEFVSMIPDIHGIDEDAKLDLLEVVKAQDDEADSTYSPVHVSNHSGNVHTVAYCRYLLDDKMKIIEVNDQFEKLTGYTREDIRNRDIYQTDLLPEEDWTEYIRLVGEQIAKAGLAYFEHRLRRKDGSIAFVFCYGKVYYDSAVKQERSEIIVFDSAETYAMKLMINEEQNKSERRLAKWEDKFRCDSLTGLLSHEAFKNDVEKHLLNGDTKVMLIMMDADKFKEYNDTYGHKAGDEYLIDLSNALTSTLRKDDLACRMGGDEFAAALFYSSKVDDQVMLDRAQQICDKLNIILSSWKGGTSLSMGAVTSDEKLNTFNKLYETSDKALYEAKAGGRARLVIYRKEK